MKKFLAFVLVLFLFSLTLLAFLKFSHQEKAVLAQTCQNDDGVCPLDCNPDNDNDCVPLDYYGSSELNPTSCLQSSNLKICFDDLRGGAIQGLYNMQEPEFNFIYPTMGGAFQLAFRSNDLITACPNKDISWGQVWNPTQAGCEGCYCKKCGQIDEEEWWNVPSSTYNKTVSLNEHYIEFRPRNYFHHDMGDCNEPLSYTTGVIQAEDIYVKQRTHLIQDYLTIEWDIKHKGDHTHNTDRESYYRHELPVMYFGDIEAEDVCQNIVYQDPQGNIHDESLPCKTGESGAKAIKNNWFTIYDPNNPERKLTFANQNDLEDNRTGDLFYRNFYADDNGMQLEFSCWADMEPNQQFTVKTYIFPYRYDEVLENGETVIDFIYSLQNTQDDNLWWNDDWSHRIKLRFNNSDTDGSLSNHRTLIRLDETKINYDDFQTNGEDIRFIDAQGNVLSHHIAVWDTNGTSYIWVKVPIIINSDDSYVYMYYGNEIASDGQNIGGMWNDSYKGIWLFNEKQTVFKDYSDYDNDKWGNFGMPIELGYPINIPSGPNRMWPAEFAAAEYSPDQNKTFIVFPGGEPEECPVGHWYCDTYLDCIRDGVIDGNGNAGIVEVPFDPYIAYYDHSDGTYSAPYKLGNSPTRWDNHNAPAFIIGADKKLHVLDAGHAITQAFYYRSQYALDDPRWSLTAWDTATTVPFSATYATGYKAIDGDLYFFGRQTNCLDPLVCPVHFADQFTNGSYIKSTDNGDSWTRVDFLNPGEGDNEYDWLYPVHYKYVTSPVEGVHVVWHRRSTDNEHTQRYHYYAFFSFETQILGPMEDHIYDVKLNDLGSTVSVSEMEDYCVYYDEGSEQRISLSSIVDVDDDGRVNIFSCDVNDDGKVKWFKWDGSNWNVTSLGNWDDSNDTAVPLAIDIKANNDLDLWLLTQEAFEGDVHDQGCRDCHSELMLYHYDGANWIRQIVYAGRSTGCIGTTNVRNGSSELQRFIWGAHGDDTELDYIWGWGSSGFVKYSNRAEITSPVGCGLHFDPSADDHPRVMSDNVLIQHKKYGGSSDFTFNDDKISVEALVKFDSLSDSGQQIINKGDADNIQGWGLWQINRNGTGRIEWVVGDGSSWHSVRSNIVVNTDTWYYIVGTMDTDTNEQNLWVNSVETSDINATWLPSWGITEMRLGTHPGANSHFLDGSLGGYVAIRDDVASDAYIKTSQENFINEVFIDYSSAEMRGDLNNDNQVNSQDIKILLQNWGDSPSIPEADLNSDGIVNGIDFGIMVKLML